jgi:8-amino-7-oxononanoate synthase
MDHPLERRIQARLSRLEDDGLTRRLAPPQGIDLSSNDYLGLATHPRLKKRFAEAVEKLGVGSTASRLLRGHRDAFRAVEERFAKFKGTASALYFSTGWAANLGVLSAFLDKGDVVFSDTLNHASIIDGIRLSKARCVVFDHADAAALELLLIHEPCAGRRFVVTESLFSMDGDRAPLCDYAQLQEKYDFSLIVDEAHAVGIYGENGSGLIEETNCAKSVFVSVNTAGKALGVAGAFVCGPAWAVDYLVQAARPFVFSTAPPPAVAEAIDEALDVISEEPQRRRRVRELALDLRRQLDLPADDSPILPIVLGENKIAVEVAMHLQNQGFDVRAIRPPTVPVGTARLRISLNANLGSDDINRFAAVLIEKLARISHHAAIESA